MTDKKFNNNNDTLIQSALMQEIKHLTRADIIFTSDIDIEPIFDERYSDKEKKDLDNLKSKILLEAPLETGDWIEKQKVGKRILNFFVRVKNYQGIRIFALTETERSIGTLEGNLGGLVGIFHKIPQAMVLLQGSKIVMVNKMAADIFRKSIINKEIIDIVDEPSLHIIESLRQQESRNIPVFEININCGDEVRPHEASFETDVIAGLDLILLRDVSEKKAGERELRQSEMTRRFLMDSIREVVCTLNADFEIDSINDSVENLLGYKAEELKLKPLVDLISRDGKAFVSEYVNGLKAPVTEMNIWKSIEIEAYKKDGSQVAIELSVSSDKKSGSGFIAVLRDITEQKEAFRIKSEEDAKFKTILEGLPVPLVVMKSNWEIQKVNVKFTKLFGWATEDLSNMQSFWTKAFPDPAISQEMSAKALSIVGNAALRNQESEMTVFHMMNRYGETLIVESRFIYLVGYGIWVFNDITELHRKEALLNKYATTDELTGVYNRRLGMQKLVQHIEALQYAKKTFSICFIDINRLKQVNDSFGHREGDEMIKIVVDTIKASIRNSDSIARLGGDEFLIIFPQCEVDEAEKVLADIHAKIAILNTRSIKSYKIGFSYGIVAYESGLSAEEFINKADQAMYIVKRSSYEN